MGTGRGAADEGRMELERGPIHRAVWENAVPLELFTVEPAAMPAEVRARLDRALAVVHRRRHAGTLHDAHGIVSDETIAELGAAGYWGLRVDPQYGGAGASFATLAAAMTEMAVADPWIAGMASTQAGIGPVSSLLDVGTPEQKARLLPPLARGERLGALAVTEPVTSSDWAQLRTTARRDGDRLLLSGEKLFITNAAPGRTLTVLCRLDGELAALIVELPWQQDERFQVVDDYALRAPAHLRNVGLRFRELPVPAANLLVPRAGDGAAIARRALNHGRVALAALAAGALRRFAGQMIPWVQRRETFGAPIGTRELVERRLGRLAARIVACDALAAWGATLLDQGYRCELEAVMVKTLGTEILKEATVDLLLKTLGARAFLAGNDFSDSVHDLLAPAIYEGENELLSLGFVASLGRAHRGQVLEPIAAAARAAGFERTDLASVRQLWAARRPLASYLTWVAPRRARQLGHPVPGTAPGDAAGLVELGGQVLRGAALELSRLMRRGGPEAAARQALAQEIASRVQRAATMLVVCQHAAHHGDPLVRTAGLCMAMELGHELVGLRTSPAYRRRITELGAAVAQDRFAPVADAERGELAMMERLPLPAEPLGEHPEAPVLLH